MSTGDHGRPGPYDVRAVRWAHGWELHISTAEGTPAGVTQARRLSGAEAMVRDYLALDTGLAPETFHLRISATMPGELGEELAELQSARQELLQRQHDLASQARSLAARLRSAGLTGAEIGAVMGVSEQRASQLLRAASSTSERSSATTPRPPSRPGLRRSA